MANKTDKCLATAWQFPDDIDNNDNKKYQAARTSLQI